MVALNEILIEQAREDDAATVGRLDPRQQDARIHAYAAGRLGAVGQRVATVFRQPR